MFTGEESLSCPMCGLHVVKLVPLYDNDNKHKNIMCCRHCKKKIRAQQPIEKISRTEIDYVKVFNEVKIKHFGDVKA